MRFRASAPCAVLVIEDDATLAENLFLTLEQEGFTPDVAYTGHMALERLAQETYDLLVLDIGLPGMDGYRVLSHLRGSLQLETPVLVLSARDALEDKMAGFASGADDYLTKPFALAEVVMRLRALHRRAGRRSTASDTLVFGPVRYAVKARQVVVGETPVRLPRKSLLILEALMRDAGNVVTRRTLEQRLWQGDPPSPDALRSQLHLLRKALASAGFEGIETISGVGWRLVDADATGRS